MNGKKQALSQVIHFLESDQKGLLITGTHMFEKHILAIAAIDKEFKNASILFRLNGMNNITKGDFLGNVGVKRQPIVGDRVRIGSNYYEFDSFLRRDTWYASSREFDVAIVYPIDSFLRDHELDALDNLYSSKHIEKIILCSWSGASNMTFDRLSGYYDTHVVFDVLEEDPAYHQRALEPKRY